MTNFDLNKDAEKVRFILEKRNVPKITAEVIAILDVSGSTREIYYNGTMQQALQRVVPVALNFDDNGSLPVYTFNDGDDFNLLETELTAADYANYVNQHIINNGDIDLWGGTDYAPVLHAALQELGFYRSKNIAHAAKGFFKRLLANDEAISAEHFSEKSKSKLPAIIYFFTDGDNTSDDRNPTKELLQAAEFAHSEVYFNFIGVGNASFTFLKEIADAYGNTGFAQIHDIEKVADSDDVYEYLLPDELTEWLKASITVQAGGRP
jgi:hypothetical protein